MVRKNLELPKELVDGVQAEADKKHICFTAQVKIYLYEALKKATRNDK